MTAADGFVFTHVSLSGATSVDSAGDMNGDGSTDLLFGHAYADVGGHSEAGAAHVVYGGAENLAALDAADGVGDGVIDLTLVAGDALLL